MNAGAMLPAEPLSSFLGASKLCDIDDALVRSTAQDLASGTETSREAAVRIFSFVRDEVKHEWVPMGQSASATLRSRSGDCWPKSIVQVALLRAAGIPARFRWLEYHKMLFAGLVPAAVYRGLADPFPFHVLAEVFLDDRWVRADATFDRALRPDRAVDWDGHTDTVALLPHEISRDLGFTTDFEERLPEIEAFFGGSDTGEKSAEDGGIDAESELVNMNFDLIRLQNRLGRFGEVLLGARS